MAREYFFVFLPCTVRITDYKSTCPKLWQEGTAVVLYLYYSTISTTTSTREYVLASPRRLVRWTQDEYYVTVLYLVAWMSRLLTTVQYKYILAKQSDCCALPLSTHSQVSTFSWSTAIECWRDETLHAGAAIVIDESKGNRNRSSTINLTGIWQHTKRNDYRLKQLLWNRRSSVITFEHYFRSGESELPKMIPTTQAKPYDKISQQHIFSTLLQR